MRHVIVKWGKLRIEVPGEVFLALLIKAFLFVHNVSGSRFNSTREVVPATLGVFTASANPEWP
jgi:hypothetical protein